MKRYTPLRRTGFKPGPRAQLAKTPIRTKGARKARQSRQEARLTRECRKDWPTCAAGGVYWHEPLWVPSSIVLAHECCVGLDTAHILSKGAHEAIRFNRSNVISLCRTAHDWFGDHPDEWKEFIERILPGRIQELKDLELRKLGKEPV